MVDKIHYAECPVCSSRSIDPLLTVKDHSVSGESFVLWQCRQCALRFTQDAPDENSISSYYQSEEYISHTNTTKGLVNRVYQGVRKYTLKQKSSLIIKETRENGSLLDIGAGTGAFVNKMKSRGWMVRGIEPDEAARKQAKDLFGLDLLDSLDPEDFPSGSFDAITLWHVLEHVHGLHDYVEALRKLLKQDGKIFIAVPNYQAIDADIYKTYWAAYDVPRHLYHFSPSSISVLMQKHGLKVVSKKPMWFDSFYISLLSSRYKRGKPFWPGAIISGLRSNVKALFSTDHCSSVLYIIEKS